MSASKKAKKPWICNACRIKNPFDDTLCQGCDLEKSRARIPRGKYYGIVRDVDREPWASFDLDGDGVLSPPEFEKLYSLLRKNHFGDSLSVFKTFDTDGSGEIDYNEFFENVKNPGPPKTEYTEIMFIKDALSVLNLERETIDDDFFDAAELKRCAGIAMTDATELLQFQQMVDRNTLSNGKIDIDDFITKLGYS
jgi:Ca2+-binding EF-hand superfamily protein